MLLLLLMMMLLLLLRLEEEPWSLKECLTDDAVDVRLLYVARS